MAENASNSESFDLDKLQQLIEMMEKHGLTEVQLKSGGEHWRLRRGPQEFMSMVPQATAVPSMAPTVPSTPASELVETPAAPAASSGHEVRSPLVGTFYSAPSPDDPDFVKVGDKVTPDTVLCLVEAMKVFNQIKAETSGTIAEILHANGDAVEFDQVLFRIKTD